MKTLYTAEAVVTGEGRDGHALLVRRRARRRPRHARRSWAATGGATNPEQLFAAGYAACFDSALRPGRPPGQGRRRRGPRSRREVGIGTDERGGFGLARQAARRRCPRVDGAAEAGRRAGRAGAPGLPVLERHAREYRRRPGGRVKQGSGAGRPGTAGRRDGRRRHRPPHGPAGGVPEPGAAVGAGGRRSGRAAERRRRQASARRCSPPGSSPAAPSSVRRSPRFYIAIFAGNIAQYTEHRDAFGLDTDTKRFARLFFQPVLVAWALWATDALRVWRVPLPRWRAPLAGVDSPAWRRRRLDCTRRSPSPSTR